MLEVVLPIPFWLELAAAVTGGLSGAMSAVRGRYDIFGTVVIACTAGLFGGIMRDILLQDYGIYAFQNPSLIVCCAIAGIVVFFFGKLVSYLDPLVDLLDNLSCGLWAVISVGKALSAGLGIIPALILGTITAIGGGVMRDVFMNRDVEAFQAGIVYGSAAFVGSTVFAILKYFHILDSWSPFICVGLILAIRYASIIFGWKTSPATDYSDTVAKVAAKPVKAVARKVAPQGKISRDKERQAQEQAQQPEFKRQDSQNIFFERHTESFPPLSENVEEPDPSDRIQVEDLQDIREISGLPRDPFEPQTKAPEKHEPKEKRHSDLD